MKERASVTLKIFLLCLLAAPAQTTMRASALRGTSSQESAAGATRKTDAARKAVVPAAWRAALERISADSMRGHLSFLSSDLLEGRGTPSRGLDIAAEYIAAQFRRAGLEPAGDDGYFQTANWTVASRDMSGFRLSFADGGNTLNVTSEQASIGFSVAGFNFWTPDDGLALTDAGVVKVDLKNSPALTREQVAGKAVLIESPELPRGDRARAFQILRDENDFLARVRSLGVPLVVAFDRTPSRVRSAPSTRLVDPESNERGSPLGTEPTAPLVIVRGAEGARLFDSLPAGASPATLTFKAPALNATPVRVRNVAGILRGSDPALKDRYVVVSAHYDHLGVREGCNPKKEDCVFNGANDDGSGTVGVVELASALAKLEPRPKRSILFITFFGEELGLLGSRYYGRHPLVPLAKTVAQLNLEQIGRTDDSEGPQVGTLAVTGFDYSDVGATLARAGVAEGVKVYKHPTNSDAYFSRSDNQSLADAGVPAHTLSVAYEYPDYHAVGDEWPKVDFANMERVVRAVAVAVLLIADDPREPRWNEQNPKTARYVEAWRKLHAR
ncbi:MAG TPA: M28 family peptidase [Pyrinomonadaceae bacterium]|nr:M28 family peptidase [Pyrinomonadaceae bacterium]